MNELPPFSAHPAPHWAALSALFGPLPPQNDPCRAVMAHQWQDEHQRVSVWQVSVGDPAWVSWLMYRAEPLVPSATTTLLSPDGCWPHVINSGAQESVLGQGVSLAWFDRVGLAWDAPDAQRGGPVHHHWPHTPWSAISVWAWALVHSVTALHQVLAEPKVGVIGHSRGGKAALLAAVCDPRIQAVIAHNTGTGGVSSLRNPPLGAERLADLAQRFPHWLSPQTQDPKHRALIEEADLTEPLLKSLAPRGLCVLQAEDDLWANPSGTWSMLERLKPAWQMAPERLRGHSRTGGHRMTAWDWQRAARFLTEVL